MEALIILFGELVFAILAPFVIFIFELIASVLGVAVSLGVRKAKVGTKWKRTGRILAYLFGGLAALVLSALIVVNTFYFDGAVRYVFGTVENRTGIVVNCQSIEGSVCSGNVSLGDCTIRRAPHASSTFDLQVDEVFLDLRVTSLLGTAKIDVARVAGLEGSIANDRSSPSKQASDERVVKPRRAFEIGDLDVSNVSITMSGKNPDGNAFELPVKIERIKSSPLRSRLALFDIMFRSNAAGSIAGAPFEIATSTIQDGRETIWRASKVPVASFGGLTGGLLSWFESGYVDVYVDDQWQISDALSIDMDWRLEFSEIIVAAPPGTRALARLTTEPLTRYVNGLDGQFPFEFQMVVNENQFEFKSSLAAAGLWSAFGESVNKTLGALGIRLEGAAKTGKALKQGAISVLDKVRKPKEPGSD